MSLRNSLRKLHQVYPLNVNHSKSSLSFLSDFLRWHKKKNFGKYNVVWPSYVSPNQRSIPSHISKPPYYITGIPDTLNAPLNAPEIKDEYAIMGMRHACQLARRVLDSVGKEAVVGKTTEDLDALAHQLIIEGNAYPSPLNYKGFPKSVCTSVNNVVCHGIPDDRRLEDGDIVNIDVTVYLKGYHGDCSQTFLIGNVDEHGRRLVEVTEMCLANAISACKPNAPFSVIGNVTEETAKSNGFTVLPAILGHGIGSYFHGPPEVWHVCNNYEGEMKPGNTFTIEPAVTQGGMSLELLDDGWTVVTADAARTAQCEHTVLITETGVEILTERRLVN